MFARSEKSPATKTIGTTWLRRLGVLGFLFFLIKGLLWLAIPGFMLLWGWLAT